MASFLAKLMNMTSAKPVNDNGGQQQQKPQQQTTQQQPVQQQQTIQNPLDFYGTLSQNKQDSKDTPPATFSVSTEQIQKAASQLDFVSGLPQDAMAKLQQGDLSALPEILNAVGRNAYQTGMQHSVAVTDKMFNERLSQHEQVMDKRIGQRLVVSNAKSINDLHPQAQAMFRDQMIKLQEAYPGASPEDIEGAVWEIMEGFAGQFNRTQKQQEQQQQQQQKAAEVDYDSMAGYAAPDSGQPQQM